MQFLSYFFSIIILLLCSGCNISKHFLHNYQNIDFNNNLKLKKVSFQHLEGWKSDNHNLAVRSLVNSCDQFALLPQNQTLNQIYLNKKQVDINQELTPADFRDACDLVDIVKSMNSNQARNFFEAWFTPFLVVDDNYFWQKKNNFTGYYQIELNGSETKDDKFIYPIYAMPSDIDKSKPYFTRQEIEDGAIKDKEILLFVDDAVRLFFMHIQGSGRVFLADGRVIKLAFAGSNNHKYYPIGKYLIEQNIINKKEMNAKRIQDWFSENPDFAKLIMQKNSSYIFFKISDEESPIGSQVVPLTPERSIAIDPAYINYGLPIWVVTQINNSEKFTKLLIAQDSGSAIKGKVRGDIFFGKGIDAEFKASHLVNSGKYYLLLPNYFVNRIKPHKVR